MILSVTRFYGQISEDPNQYEESTLEAIRVNIAGLRQISGERIWTELRKILGGKFFDSVTLKLLELGAGQFIGLSENPNVSEFQKLCFNVKNLDLKIHPITFMSAFLRDQNEVNTINVNYEDQSDLSNSTICIRGANGLG